MPDSFLWRDQYDLFRGMTKAQKELDVFVRLKREDWRMLGPAERHDAIRYAWKVWEEEGLSGMPPEILRAIDEWEIENKMSFMQFEQ